MPTHSCILANGALSDTRFANGGVLLNWAEFAASGLVLYHLNTGSGTTALDGSGNANNASLATGNWNSSPWMGASAMGASDTLTPGTVPTLGTANWTIEGWFYAASNPNDAGYLYAATVAGPSGQVVRIGFRRTSGALQYWPRVVDNAAHGTGYSGPNIQSLIGTWIHVALVKDGNTVRLYSNGIQGWTLNVTDWTWSAWTSSYWTTDAYMSGWDELRLSSTAVYPDGTSFSPIRYPASGTWTEAAGEAQANCLPGVLTVTLAEALPAGTSLKCKLLGGGDTGWQVMAGAGTSYSYDFTGQAAGNWYAAVQLLPGGALNANTPEVTAAGFEYETFSSSSSSSSESASSSSSSSSFSSSSSSESFSSSSSSESLSSSSSSESLSSSSSSHSFSSSSSSFSSSSSSTSESSSCSSSASESSSCSSSSESVSSSSSSQSSSSSSESFSSSSSSESVSSSSSSHSFSSSSSSTTPTMSRHVQIALRDTLRTNLPGFVPAATAAGYYLQSEEFAAVRSPAVFIYDRGWTRQFESTCGSGQGLAKRRYLFDVDVYLRGRKADELRNELQRWADAVAAVVEAHWRLGIGAIDAQASRGEATAALAEGSSVLMATRIQVTVDVYEFQGAVRL